MKAESKPLEGFSHVSKTKPSGQHKEVVLRQNNTLSVFLYYPVQNIFYTKLRTYICLITRNYITKHVFSVAACSEQCSFS